jgi:hypothetical protein
MSYEYDEYLRDHKENVRKGYYWLRENLPDIAKPRMDWQICYNHDTSKTGPYEYEAYDEYFYGRNKSYAVVQEFNRAWLHHIHENPHHWQHWILVNDDPDEGEIIMDMDDVYIVEMVCDWWAFSWKKGDLHEIFNWYDQHKDYMKLSTNTRKKVEDILDKIKTKLEGSA